MFSCHQGKILLFEHSEALIRFFLVNFHCHLKKQPSDVYHQISFICSLILYNWNCTACTLCVWFLSHHMSVIFIFVFTCGSRLLFFPFPSQQAILWASQVMLVVKEPDRQCRRCKRHGFSPWVRKISGRKAQQPTPVLLPGKSRGQRSLVGYSPWSHRVGHD